MKKILLSFILILISAIAAMANGHTVGVSSKTNVYCTGMNTGSATVTVSGGVGPFTYSWSPVGGTDTIAINLSAGSYTVTVTDQNDLSTATALVNITQPAMQLTIASSTSSTPICSGECAIITTTTSGGIPPYNYSWTPTVSFGPTPTVCPTTTTTYTVVLSDSYGCTATASAIVNILPGPTINITGPTTVCAGQSTTLTAAGGGTYSWNTGATTAAITVTPPPYSQYIVTVTAGNGCTNSQCVIVSTPVVFAEATYVLCSANNGGCTTFSAGGGTAPYTYDWQPGGSTWPSITGVPAGTYTVTMTDLKGCTATATAEVTSKYQPLAGVTISDSIYKETCLGVGDGEIDIKLSGSNPGPFIYEWDNGKYTPNNTNLVSNNYTLTIWDSTMNNCIKKNYQVTPDGTYCGSLSGNIFDDKNSDCIKNAGDIALSSIVLVANPGNHWAFANSQGDYTFYSVPFGTYTVTQQLYNPYIFNTCTTSYNATLNAANKTITNLHFADTVSSTAKDVSVSVSMDPIIRGFDSSIGIYLYNIAFVSASGTLCITLPQGFGSQITSGTTPGFTINGDTICWGYSNLIHDFGSYFSINLSIPNNVLLGATLTVCASATVIGGDVNLSNNYSCAQRIVTGSYDPNDKTVSPMGRGPQGNITSNDKTLSYHIRFQNTGNGPAVNIVVKDTLSDKLDISTLEVIGASHNYILDILESNILRWKFNNIMLADSSSDEPASHGWISYRIKQKSSNQIGDQIKNTAHIYFDFNPAIVTNTTVNTIVSTIGIEELSSSNDVVKVYPNPFSDNTTFVIQSNKPNESYSFELLDVLGKQVRFIKEINTREFQLSRNGLPNGIYFYKIYSAESIAGIGKLVIK